MVIAGSVALLLWGTRMARTGFLRAFGAELRRFVAASTKDRFRAAATGLVSASLLQSSTAAALLAASFASAGLLDVSAGLAIMLGADIGSALIAQVFTLNVTGFWPALMFVGYVLHTAFYDRSPRIKQYGRITMGLGLMLLALNTISGASGEMRESTIVLSVLGALNSEPFLALLIAVILTWVAHSSLAVILLVASLAASGVLTTTLALVLVLGVNAGAALPALIITLSEAAEARRIAVGNMVFRVSGVLLLLPCVYLLEPYVEMLGSDGGRQVMTFHLLFNLGLMMLFIGLTGPVARFTGMLVRPDDVDEDEQRPQFLDETAKELPAVALGLAARETLRMADIVETMLHRSMRAIEANDRTLCEEIRATDDRVDDLYEAIKLYLTDISREQMEDAETRRCFEIMSFTSNLENIGDTIDKNLLDEVDAKIRGGKSFSPEGLGELRELHGFVMKTARMASTVFIDRDVSTARELLVRKAQFRTFETSITDAHLERVRCKRTESIETSGIHLDLLRDFKRINSHFASVAYPILEEAGLLRETRLKKIKERSAKVSPADPAPDADPAV